MTKNYTIWSGVASYGLKSWRNLVPRVRARYLTEWVRVTALSLNFVHSQGFSLKKMGGTGEGKNPGNEIDEIDISRPSHFLDKKP